MPCPGGTGSSSSSTIGSSSSSIGGGSSSSSSLPGSSSSSIGGSSSSHITGDIPQEFHPLLNYRVLATGDLTLADRITVSGGTFGGNYVEVADRITVSGGTFGGNYVEVGSQTSLDGELISSGNVYLRNNATTGNITLSGSLETQAGASHGNVVRQPVSLPAVPQISFTYGTADLIIERAQTATVTPGRYKNFNVFVESEVTFEPGDYYFKSFVVEPDVQLHFNNSNGAVRIWVEEGIFIGDRVNVQNNNAASRLFLYTNTSNTLYFGVGSDISAMLVAPNGNVSLAPHSRWSGSVWGKNISLQPASGN